MENQDPAKTEYTSGAGCLTRLYWMFAGNAALAISFGMLIDRHPKFPSLFDAACLLFLASLVYVRYIDIRHFKGENGANTAPATMDDWKKYALFLTLGSVGVWLAVRLLVPLFVNNPGEAAAVDYILKP